MSLRPRQAKKILDDYCLRETGKPASSAQITKDMRKEGRKSEWFLAHQDTCPPWDGERTRAYFKAYVEIAGARFYGSGIPVHDRYMQPDRAVMKSLLLAECVFLEGGKFILTPKGEALLASIPPFDEYVEET